jgi:hypothetical protein
LDKTTKYFAIRRSTRLPLEIPVRVTSLDAKVPFAEDCTTVTVSAHGCGVIAPGPVQPGTRVQLEIVADKQSTQTRVLEVVPLNDEKTSWLLGIELDRPGNFWGIKYAPADWAEAEDEAPKLPSPAESVSSASAPPPLPTPATVDKTVPVRGSTLHIHGPLPPKLSVPANPNPAAAPSPVKPPAASAKELPAAVLRRLLSECRLAAISAGACYVQTGTTFPMHAPVKLVVQAGGNEHSFHGTVRVEHVGAGMGIEFSASGDEHSARIAKLIEALGANGDKIPQVRVELAAPDKTNPPKSKSAVAAAAQYDSLLGLVLVGGSLKRSDFLHELEQQRNKT